MNAREYIDEVLTRLTRLQVVLKLDPPQVLTYINRARRIVQQLTVKYEPERYAIIYEFPILDNQYVTDFVDVSYSMPNLRVYYINLPNELLDVFVYIIRWIKEGVTYRSEAREHSRYEMQNILRNTWRVPTPYNPVYCVNRELVNNVFIWRAYMAGLQFDENETIMQYNPIAEIWATKTIEHIEDYNITGQPDDELFIPPAFEELVINYAMLFCLQQVHNEFAYNVVMTEIQYLENIMNVQREMVFQKQELLLPSKEGENA